MATISGRRYRRLKMKGTLGRRMKALSIFEKTIGRIVFMCTM